MRFGRYMGLVVAIQVHNFKKGWPGRDKYQSALRAFSTLISIFGDDNSIAIFIAKNALDIFHFYLTKVNINKFVQKQTLVIILNCSYAAIY